ncbi:MAG: glucose-6-phosphate 1-epimerase [Acidobacteriaceae bacterium]|jgi:glucose-6-phosphate 1-epimerase|nr:glucose-6-phosphate 1-epimerase [Acidobacteriaceae bacterium]
MSEVDELNARFGLKDALRFEDGPGGLTRARIATDRATAEIYLQGAHVARWQPASAAHPVLFLSDKSHFEVGKAIRGGVPLVFPWFAERKDGLPGGMHGFARTLPWEVVAAERRAEGVALSFKLLPNQTTRDLGFDHFVLVYEVVVGATLTLALEVENVGDTPLRFDEALHAYYSVSDVRQIEVSGIGDTDYLDRADNAKPKHQGVGAIRFAGETDQLHLNTQEAVTISDPVWRRRMVIEKRGSKSTVVWNPWQAKASALADLGAEAWPHFVCVEPANAAENAVTVAPGATHTMGMTVRVEGA